MNIEQAHDTRNNLAVIRGRAQIASRRLSTLADTDINLWMAAMDGDLSEILAATGRILAILAEMEREAGIGVAVSENDFRGRRVHREWIPGYCKHDYGEGYCPNHINSRSEYCNRHDPIKIQERIAGRKPWLCRGRRKNGQPCREVRLESGYCRHHEDQSPEVVSSGSD